MNTTATAAYELTTDDRQLIAAADSAIVCLHLTCWTDDDTDHTRCLDCAAEFGSFAECQAAFKANRDRVRAIMAAAA